MLLELLKSPVGSNSTITVELGQLQTLLWELFGSGQASSTAPGLGSTFPAGQGTTGTVPMVAVVDVVSLSSPSGATPALKTTTLPAGALSTTGCRGIRVRAWGSFANNVNAKTVVLKFGATTLNTVTATTSTANSWAIDASVYVRTATTQTANSMSMQGAGTPTFVTLDTTPGETLSGTIAVACSGTQTSAADIIQDGFTVDYIP